MSTLAAWLFVAVAVLFVATLIGVFLAGRSTYKRSRALEQEMTGLVSDLDESWVRSVSQGYRRAVDRRFRLGAYDRPG